MHVFGSSFQWSWEMDIRAVSSCTLIPTRLAYDHKHASLKPLHSNWIKNWFFCFSLLSISIICSYFFFVCDRTVACWFGETLNRLFTAHNSKSLMCVSVCVCLTSNKHIRSNNSILQKIKFNATSWSDVIHKYEMEGSSRIKCTVMQNPLYFCIARFCFYCCCIQTAHDTGLNVIKFNWIVVIRFYACLNVRFTASPNRSVFVVACVHFLCVGLMNSFRWIFEHDDDWKHCCCCWVFFVGAQNLPGCVYAYWM